MSSRLGSLSSRGSRSSLFSSRFSSLTVVPIRPPLSSLYQPKSKAGFAICQLCHTTSVGMVKDPGYRRDRLRVAPDADFVYAVITTKRRWVEAKITAPNLGTWGGGSQWCNRLPGIITISVAGFVV